MKLKPVTAVALALLAVIFAIALTFVSIEIPQLADNFLQRHLKTPNIATGGGSMSDYQTEIFIQHYHLRLLGYSSLGLILLLIVVGYFMNKSRMAFAGAIGLFLPVFGHFAITMFFLGGLGFLRLIWLPFLDVSLEIMSLGDIVLLPYTILLKIGAWFGLYLHRELAWFFTALGLLLFIFGMMVWFYSRYHRHFTADFWLYRLSRHPQYLGWIIWSYGILLLPGANIKQYVTIANTLPWLLSTMIIIGIAMLEELKMQQQDTGYQAYRGRTPFLLWTPRWFSRIVSAPMRWVIRGNFPKSSGEIVRVILTYTIILISLSWGRLNWDKIQLIGQGNNQAVVTRKFDVLIEKLNATDSRRTKYYLMQEMAQQAELAGPLFIELLENPDAEKREFAAQFIFEMKPDGAVPGLLKATTDKNRNVRQTALAALVEIRPEAAAPSLYHGLRDPDMRVRMQAAASLGEIGPPTAFDSLLNGIQDPNQYARMAHLDALAKLNPERAIQPLTEALADNEVKVRRKVALILSQLTSPNAVAPLQQALTDPDWEVRLYAKEGLKKIE